MYGADTGQTINDYDFAYIVLFRSDYKDEKKFEDYCEFMAVSKNSETIKVPIDMFAAEMISSKESREL